MTDPTWRFPRPATADVDNVGYSGKKQGGTWGE
jgi:hypothetical protein